MTPTITTAIVRTQLSRKTFMVELPNGDTIEMDLKPKQVLHYIKISIGMTIHLMLIPPDEKRGLLLTATDFKINGWNGGPNPDDY